MLLRQRRHRSLTPTIADSRCAGFRAVGSCPPSNTNLVNSAISVRNLQWSQWLCQNENMSEAVILIANGDLRLSANQRCWAAQARAEEAVTAAIRHEGRDVKRGHACDPIKQHGFIDSQKRGLEVFREIPPEAPLVVVEAVWQYSHHLLHGLYTHKGPILTVANWSGEWPGLVGLLNLNASLTKAGVPYSSLWSADFRDDFFLNGLRCWLAGQPVADEIRRVPALADLKLPARAEKIDSVLAAC